MFLAKFGVHNPMHPLYPFKGPWHIPGDSSMSLTGLWAGLGLGLLILGISLYVSRRK